ncbi:MAG: hypothetical protein DRI48_04465, partial [Chloroflexi bacterium]
MLKIARRASQEKKSDKEFSSIRPCYLFLLFLLIGALMLTTLDHRAAYGEDPTIPKEDDTEEKPSCDSDPCDDDGSEGDQNNSECKNQPVDLLTGSVLERITDVHLPGTGLSWSHTRMYNSRLVGTGDDPLPGVNGIRWRVRMLGSYLLLDDSDNVEYHIDAEHKRLFTEDSGSYIAPHDYRATLKYFAPGNVTTSGTADANAANNITDNNADFGDNDSLVGCIVRFTSGNHDGEWRVITGNSSTTVAWGDNVSPNFDGNPDYEICDRAVLRFIDSGKKLEFAGISGKNGSNWAAGQRGLLIRRSDAYGNNLTYTYDDDTGGGRIIQVTTSQGWSVEYTYVSGGDNDGRISYLIVKNDSSEMILGAAYVYHDGDDTLIDANCGEPGDLVMVHSCKDIAGTGEAGSGSDSDTLAHSDASFANNAVSGYKLIMVDGSNAGHIRSITASTGSTITVSPAFGHNIAEGDSYIVVRGEIRTTHYRYHDGTGDGNDHQLKMVLEPDKVAALVEDHSLNSAGDILTKTDTEDLGSGDTDTVEEYASRSFTYYKSHQATSNVDTPWGGSGENLEGRYGGSNFDEGETTEGGITYPGYVKSELIGGSCSGCGGSSDIGAKWTFFYMDLNGGPDADVEENVVARLIVQDITVPQEGAADTKIRRVIYGLNKDGVLLREATIVDPSSPKMWCRSIIVGTGAGAEADELTNRVLERRMPSAHKGSVAYNPSGEDDGAKWQDVEDFLNPTGNSGNNDSNTLNDSSGLIYVTEYDFSQYPNYYIVYTAVAEGEEGRDNRDSTDTFSWIGYSKYTKYGTNDAIYRLTETYQCTTATITKPTSVSDDDKTRYSYTTYSGTDSQQVQTRTITHPKVTSAENGTGTATTEKEYYDEKGHLRWHKDAEGRITYYSYHPDTGGLAYVMRDVDTNPLHSDITSNGNGTRVAWSGSAPTGFQNDDDDAIQIVTKYEYDDQGRQTKTEGPRSLNTTSSYSNVPATATYTVYKDKKRYVFPEWDSTSHEPLLPIRVTVTDEVGRTTHVYTVDPSKRSPIDSEPPTGLTTTNTDYVYSLTRYNYNDKGQLTSVDHFHTIPHGESLATLEGSGFGTEGTNYHRTEYQYDDMGRQYKVIDPNDTVTETVYDELGRVKEIKKGPSGSLVTVSKTYYDGATSDTLVVGDGHVTLRKTYYDASNSYDTYYKYDYRGRLTHRRGPDKVTSYYDLDNLGRTKAQETYYDGDADFDLSDAEAKRYAKTETKYDKLGRVYQRIVHEVNQSDGSLGGSMTTNYWYDGEGRQVKAKGPGNAFSKTVYDGAGRALYEAVCTAERTGPGDDSAYNLKDDTIHGLTKYIYDFRGRVIETKRGTSVTYTGSDITSDNTVTVSKTYYDDDRNGANEDDWGPQVTGRAVLEPSSTTTTNFVTTEYTYDNAGRLEWIKPPAGPWTQRVYDDLGRLTESWTNNRNIASGNMLAKSTWVYNGTTGQLDATRVWKVTGGSATADYVETKYAYDDFGRQCKVTFPSGGFTKTEYNRAGQVTHEYLCTHEGTDEGVDDVTDD